MWRLSSTPTGELPGLPAFVAAVNAQRNLFQPDAPVRVARAPGRLDLMGGIADYSGALVLELPLACATFAAVQLVGAPELVVRSLPLEPGLAPREVRVALADLAPAGAPLAEAAAHKLLTAVPSRGLQSSKQLAQSPPAGGATNRSHGSRQAQSK